jgi:tetratricopeptide (TPR) repeat protein
MGILSGLKSALAGKPTLEQYERKTTGLPPKEASQKWIEFAEIHKEDSPDNAMYGYRKAAALLRQAGEMEGFTEQSLNYAKAAERVPKYSVAGDGFRVVAEHSAEGAEEFYAQAGENYHKAGESAKADRRTTRAGDMYAAAAEAFEKAKKYEQAIEDYMNSNEIAERKKHLIRVARDQGKIAENYLRLGDFDKAAEYFVKHAEAETGRGHVDYSDGFSRAGDAFVRAGKLNEAAEAYLKDAEFANEPGYGYRNAAECYQKLGETEKAVEHYMKEAEDDLEKDRAFVAWETLKIVHEIAEDKSEVEEKMKEVKVPSGFERASEALGDTLKREFEQKGL